MVEVEENGEVKVRLDRPYKMTAQKRRSTLKQNKHKRLLKFIDVKKHFSSRPYTFTPQGVDEVELYENLGGSPMHTNDEVPMNMLRWLAIIS